jgi:hypothetical protein
MGSLQSIWVVAGMIFLINIPFGYWRATVRSFSRSWFLAIHIPVVVSIGLKLSAGIGFALVLLPLFVGVFFMGQLVGGAIQKARTPLPPRPRSPLR